ncbi:E3 ubiquitin-protein ligase ptr1 [Astathelohania contejeani]|uniref:HECT-type E3 ubiquitin transferase n=1 Tax=Astathelohania contejeani TaxID=164912 RepID=A0ABQ7HY04_9MICR|nr:E3 ubiquitin-protein ligase ptr1 [Thelohania contejeani]
MKQYKNEWNNIEFSIESKVFDNIINYYFAYDEESCIPIQIKEFNLLDSTWLYHFFKYLSCFSGSTVTEISLIFEILNKNIFFLLFSKDFVFLRQYCKYMLILTTKINISINNTIESKLIEIVGIILDTFFVYNFFPEKLDTKNMFLYNKNYKKYFNEHHSAFIQFFVSHEDKNDIEIRIEAFMIMCSFYFHCLNTKIFVSTLFITKYVYLLMNLKYSNLNRDIILLGISKSIINLDKNIQIEYNEVNYTFPFPLNIIIFNRELYKKFYDILSKKISSLQKAYDSIEIIKFYINNPCLPESFFSFINIKTEKEFFNVYTKRIFKFQTFHKKHEIIEILNSFVNYITTINFYNALINESIEVLKINEEEINASEVINSLSFIIELFYEEEKLIALQIGLFLVPNIYYNKNGIFITDDGSCTEKYDVIYYNAHLIDILVDINSTYKKMVFENLKSNIIEFNDLFEYAFEKKETKKFEILAFLIIFIQLETNKLFYEIYDISEEKINWLETTLMGNEKNIEYLCLYNAFIYSKMLNNLRNMVLYLETINISINRNIIYDNSKNMLDQLSQQGNLNLKLNITFSDAIDSTGDGIFRTWLTLLAIEFSKPSNFLFNICNSDTFTYYPSLFTEEALHNKANADLKFIGRIIGIALRHDFILPIEFSKCVYEIFLSKEINIDKILQSNNSLRTKFHEMETYTEDLNDVGLSFTMDVIGIANGKYIRTYVELCPNGNDLIVTKDNFNIFKKLYLNRFLEEFIKSVNEMKLGLLEMVNKEILDDIKIGFKLKRLISGNMEINVNDWKLNTKYIGWNSDDETIRWFWEFIEYCKGINEKLNKLLIVLIGTSHLPPGGFKNLSNGNFKIVRLDDINNTVCIHTCINVLRLSKFDSKEILFMELEIFLNSVEKGTFFNLR